MTAYDAFREEAATLSAVLVSVSETEYDRPTRCTPWTVRALLAHIGMGADRILTMLAEPEPSTVDTDAAGYYRPDKRFSPAANSERVDGAVAAAARAGSGAALARRFEETWRAVFDAALRQPDDRIVRTRHGDAMLLSEFMVTRVVELAVHGLDLADALDRPPWTHAASLDVLVRLLLPDRLGFVRAATNRAGGGNLEGLRAAGIRVLALG